MVNIELSDLEVFRTVAREGGVIRAAERLHRVQSAVTQRIKRMEDTLGVPLFIREARGMRLTPAGETLLGYAERILDLAASATSAVRGGVPSGPFRVGSMESTAAMRLAAPLSQLTETYREIDLNLTVATPETLLQSLKDSRLEAIFLAGDIDMTGLEAEVVFSEPMALVSPAADRGGWPETLLVFGQDCPNRARLFDWYASTGQRPKRTVELGSYHAMLGSIAIGLGSGVMPEGMLATFPERHRLQARRLPEPFDRLDTRLIWRHGARSPRIDALLGILGADQRDTVMSSSTTCQ